MKPSFARGRLSPCAMPVIRRRRHSTHETMVAPNEASSRLTSTAVRIVDGVSEGSVEELVTASSSAGVSAGCTGCEVEEGLKRAAGGGDTSTGLGGAGGDVTAGDCGGHEGGRLGRGPSNGRMDGAGTGNGATSVGGAGSRCGESGRGGDRGGGGATSRGTVARPTDRGATASTSMLRRDEMAVEGRASNAWAAVTMELAVAPLVLPLL